MVDGSTLSKAATSSVVRQMPWEASVSGGLSEGSAKRAGMRQRAFVSDDAQRTREGDM
jgi:hypothetical protein